MPAAPETVYVIFVNGSYTTVTNVVGSPVAVDLPVSRTGTTSSSTTIAMTDTSGVAVGQIIRGPGVPPNTTVTAVTANTSITISNATTTTLTNPTVFCFSDGYYDGDTYRNEINTSDFAGFGGSGEYWVIDDRIGGQNYGSTTSPTYGVPTGGNTSIPPRFWQKKRTQIQFNRQDSNGNTLGIRWFWADEIQGFSDSIPAFG